MAVTSQRRQSLIPGRGAFCLAPGLLHHWCDDKNISRISSSAKFCNYFFNCAFFFFSILSIKKSLIASSPVVPTEKKKSKTELTTPACIMVYAIPQQDFVFAIFKKEILFLVLENKGISSRAPPRSLGSGCLGAASPCLPYPRHGSNETKMIRGKLDHLLMKGFLSVVSFDLVQWLEVLRRNGIIGNRSSWGWQKQLLLVGTSQTLLIFLQRQIDSSDRLSETIS